MRKHNFQVEPLISVASWVGLNENSVMVEVGCYRGESTEMWASNDCLVFAIDPWERGLFNLTKPKHLFSALKNNFKAMHIRDFFTANRHVEEDFDAMAQLYPNIKKIKGTGTSVSQLFDDCDLDFVYIDALHDYDSVKEDIKAWLPKIKSGCYIGGHDYCETWPDVIKAVDECVGKPDHLFPDSSWIKQIN